MTRVQVCKTVSVPDRMRLARYARAPELGPKVLFFSGGTALKRVSRALKSYTHNSIHLITPFDSGGSSASLRAAFRMPSVGDLRNRLMALADETVQGNPEIYDLFKTRFPAAAEPAALREELESMIRGRHPLVAGIPDPMRKIIRNHLRYFLDRMPADFDLCAASIGNLILTGGYLMNGHHLDPVVFLFSKLVEVRGVVRPIVGANLHLVAELEDGTRVCGQHRLTGKEHPPIASPVTDLYLSSVLGRAEPQKVAIREKTRKLIAEAELICYPPGSFYSSLIANFLPRGVGHAIAQNESPKVYVPNSGVDPEQFGMTLDRAVMTLLKFLHRTTPRAAPTERLLNFMLVDMKRGAYPSPVSIKAIERMGVRVVDLDLVSDESAPYYDPRKLAEALLSLV